jgi:hypothetical protein
MNNEDHKPTIDERLEALTDSAELLLHSVTELEKTSARHEKYWRSVQRMLKAAIEASGDESDAA